MNRGKLYRLGRQPHDPADIARMPQLAGHALASAPVPVKLVRDHVNYWPGLYGNDNIGDCTAAGLANAARAQAALNGFDIPITQQAVENFYSASCGYNPNAPLVDDENPTDQGGNESDVLAYQLMHGFDHGGQDLLVGDFATFDPHDMDMHRRVMTRCGTCYLGVALSVSDQQAAIWDIDTPASAGDPTPGSWGLHCLLSWTYTGTGDEDLVTLLTWGMKQPARWRWLRSRVQEAHAVVWRQLLSPESQSSAGLDFDRLRADGLKFVV